MSNFFRITSLVGVFFIFVCFNAFGYTLKDIEKVEKQTLDNRRAVKNWHVRTRSVRTLYRENGAVLDDIPVITNGEKQKRIYTDYYYDGKHHRTDVCFEMGEHSKQCTDFVFWDDIYYYHYTIEPGNKWAVQADTIEYVSAKGVKPRVLDIRVFGMVPVSFALWQFELTTIIGNPDRRNLEMTDDVLNGVACRKIQFDWTLGNSDRTSAIWITPEQGYNPIRFESWNHGTGFKQNVDIKIEKHKESGIWFPISYVADEWYKGKLYSHDECRLEIFSFNKPLPEETFTLKGIGAPIGTRIYVYPPINVEDNFYWDGEKVTGEFGTSAEPIEPPKNNNHFIVFVIAFNLAFISIVCFLWYLKLRRKNRQ
jgi:hypothetical protein